MSHSPHTQRTRVSGQRSRWPLFVALLGAGLLALLVYTALQKPAPDAAPVTTPSPVLTPTPKPSQTTIYAKVFSYDPELQARIIAYDQQSLRELYNFGNGDAFVLDPGHQQIIIATAEHLRAVDLRSLVERWRVPLRSPYNPLKTRLSLHLNPTADTVTLIATTNAEDGEGVALPNGGEGTLESTIERYATSDGAFGETLTSFASSANPLLLWQPFAGQINYTVLKNTVVRYDRTTDTAKTVLAETVPLRADTTATEVFAVRDGKRVVLYVLDAQSNALTSYPLEITPSAGELLGVEEIAVSPDGQQVALWVREYLPSLDEIYAGRRNVGLAFELFLYDRGSGTLTLLPDTPSYASPISLDFSASGDLLLTAGPALYLYSADTGATINRNVLNQEVFQQSAFGPPLQMLDLLPPTPTLLPLDPLPTPTPLPTRTGASSDPLAWLWRLDPINNATSVLRVLDDGTLEPLATGIIDVLPRPGQSPLLVQSSNNQLRLLDPVLSTTLELPVSSLAFNQAPPLAMNVRRLLLSPDGRQLALLTQADPLPNDAIEGSHQLIVIDLASQSVAVVMDVLDADIDLYNGGLAGWTADGIYMLSSKQLNSEAVPTSLWRVAPTANSTPTRVWDVPEGAVIDMNLEQGILLYEPYPAELAHSELRVLDLNASTDQAIYAGTFINSNELSLAPDGRRVAFIQPRDLQTTSTSPDNTLVVVDLASGATQTLAEDVQSSWAGGGMLWSADSAQVALWQGSMDLSAGSNLVSFDVATGARRVLAHKPTPYFVFFSEEQMTYAPQYLDDSYLLNLVSQPDAWYLQQIPLADPVEPLMLKVWETVGTSMPGTIYLIYAP